VDEHHHENAEHIHIVEDDDKVAALLGGQLARFGYRVTRTEQWNDIAAEVQRFDPDLILLDINLPYYDGFYWCRQMRRFSRVPIIFISARNSGMDQVMAIESGGDDYITKPFMAEVVLAKVRALLRRTYGDYARGNSDGVHKEKRGLPGAGRDTTLDSGRDTAQDAAHDTTHRVTHDTTQDTAHHVTHHTTHDALRVHLEGDAGELTIGRLHLDLRRATVTVLPEGDSASVTKTELALLGALMDAHGAVVRREVLLDRLWDDTQFVDDNTLTVNVTRVRRKLTDLGLTDAVTTVRGLGYQLNLFALGARP
jgi:two-component system, OmpR family, response regulator